MSKSAKINAAIITVLIVIVAVSIIWIKHRHPVHKDNTPPVLVKLGKPYEKLMPNTITSTGNLEAIQTTNLSSKISGYVTKINYQEGTTVKKGQLLIQLDNRKEQAAVRSAKAQNNISDLKYHQSEKMYHRRLEAYDDYVAAKTNHEKDEAALQTVQTDLADKSIRAPFSGTTGAKAISIGDFVQPGSTLVTLTNLNKLRVTYSLPATVTNSLHIGQTITLNTPSVSDNSYKATVSYVSPSVDPSSQTITVHADIDNSQRQLKPGLFVNVQQTLGDPIQVTVIPTNALFASLRGYYVLGVKKGKAYKIPVRVGRKLQNSVVITQGLALGHLFITEGQSKIEPGSRVNIVKG
jgi:RND family efflux transporter MFP subunit